DGAAAAGGGGSEAAAWGTGEAVPYRPPLFMTAPSSRLAAPPAPARGAGESKGVTFEQNKRQLEQLRLLTMLEGNRTCADCASPAAAARPSWASINLGVFLCMRCAGVHRGLGVHVSRVRSTTLDTWLPEQVDNMARLGNKRANAHFEAALTPGVRPPRDCTRELERFVRLKYVDKVWAAKGPWPPEEEQPPAPAGSQGVTRGSLPTPPAIGLGAPAPAASRSGVPGGGPGGAGGFGDAPPAWTAFDSLPSPAGAAAPSRPQPAVAAVRLPPPPPVDATGVVWPPQQPQQQQPQPAGWAGTWAWPGNGSGAGRAGSGGGGGGGDLLLQLDSEEDEDDEEEGEGGAACAGGAGAAPPGGSALWELLDPSLD
ncbi:hypothetical protein Agub_g15398, partial [Astrephomene gubernaculifera]